MSALAAALRARIAADGPLRLDHWMAACNAHYYATRDPFGTAGDFVTAPEISQMFGELIGAWIVDLWVRAGSPPCRLVELGPGRGTLMTDALRVAQRVPGFDAVPVDFVETSPALRAAQATRVPGAVWHAAFDDVPDDRPLIVIANEFFDALPVRHARLAPLPSREGLGEEQFVATDFAPVWLSSDTVRTGEWSDAGETVAAAIGTRLRNQGGAALIIDYGYAGESPGDTVQAMRGHATADPFRDPGENDVTAHVDFTALAQSAGVAAHGPVPQGVWLARLGIEARTAALKARATPTQAAGIEAALVRLTAPQQMGTLFKAMALTAPGWPVPAGFAA